MAKRTMTSKHTMTKHHPSMLEQRAVEVHRRAGGLIRPIGVLPIPAGPIGLSVDSAEWVVTAAEDDPQLANGGFVAPAEVIRRLRHLHAAKVGFDRIYVAHELPVGSLASIGDRSSAGKAGPLDRGTLAGLIPEAAPHPRTMNTLKLCTAIATAATAAAVVPIALGAALPVATAGAIGSLLDLDPALLGVVTSSGRAESGELASWFLIAAWT